MRGTRLATPTIDVRVARLERRAEADDDTLRSVLRILERMDRRFASVEADVATLKTDMISVKTDVATLKSDVATLKTDTVSVKADIATLKTDLVSVKADIETLTTVTDVLALKVATIEDTTADTNRRVRIRGFEE